MIKIFLFSFFLFILELFVTPIFLNTLPLYKLWKLNFKDQSQRRIFYIQNYLMKYNRPASILAFGGSGTREFFTNDNNMTTSLRFPFFNCAVSSESTYDSLKLMTLSKTDDIILYGLHIKSMYAPSFNTKKLTEAYYYGGTSYKYPINIPYNFISHLLSDENNITLTHRFSPIINTYSYLFKEYIKRRNIYQILKINNNIPTQYYYINRIPLPYKTLYNKLKIYLEKVDKQHTKSIDLNFKIIDYMLQISKNKGQTFILYELPYSPIIYKFYKNKMGYLYEKIKSLQKKYPHMIFIPNSSLPKGSQNIFYDTIHLLPQGRDFYYKKSVESIKKVLSHGF